MKFDLTKINDDVAKIFCEKLGLPFDSVTITGDETYSELLVIYHLADKAQFFSDEVLYTIFDGSGNCWTNINDMFSSHVKRIVKKFGHENGMKIVENLKNVSNGYLGELMQEAMDEHKINQISEKRQQQKSAEFEQ